MNKILFIRVLAFKSIINKRNEWRTKGTVNTNSVLSRGDVFALSLDYFGDIHLKCIESTHHTVSSPFIFVANKLKSV